MSGSERASFLSHPVPLWAAAIAVLVGIMASGTFAFTMALLFVKTGIVDWQSAK